MAYKIGNRTQQTLLPLLLMIMSVQKIPPESMMLLVRLWTLRFLVFPSSHYREQMNITQKIC